MQKKKNEGFSEIISSPLKSPLSANFTTKQIPCKSMVHHEPWGTSQFTCSLLAIYRSCAFSYMTSLSGTQMFNANGKFANIVAWQREPLCAPVFDFGSQGRVNIPIAKFKMDLEAFCETSKFRNSAPKNTD